MKKFFNVIIIVMLCILATTFLVMAKDYDYYPAKMLDSTEMDQQAMDYFKEVLNKSLGLDNCIIGIFNRDGYMEVWVYEIDSDGKAIKSYEIYGDLLTDMLSGIRSGDPAHIGFSYEIQVTGNQITGTRKDE